MTKRRKFLLVPFGGVALLLALVATAYACTVFRGTLSLKGNRADSGTVTATGLRTGMAQTVSSEIARSDKTGTVQVWTGADGSNKLPHKKSDGTLYTYYLKYYNKAFGVDVNRDGVIDPGYSDHTHWMVDCMAGGPGEMMSKVNLNSSGAINSLTPGSSGATLSGNVVTLNLTRNYSGATLTSTADVAPTESAICISDPGAAYGNEAPLTIV